MPKNKLTNKPTGFEVSRNSAIRKIGIMVGCLLCCACLGCQQENVQLQHISYPHRPHDYKQAVLRLQEIHQILVSDAPLPKPRIFQSIECEDHAHDVHDHHAEYQEVTEEAIGNLNGSVITITLANEWFDLVSWLPMIAADSNLPKNPWDEISRCSDRLLEISAGFSAAQDQEFRVGYLQEVDQFSEIYRQLRDIFSDYDQWHEAYPY